MSISRYIVVAMAEVLLRLLARACAAVELAETAVTAGDERACTGLDGCGSACLFRNGSLGPPPPGNYAAIGFCQSAAGRLTMVGFEVKGPPKPVLR